MELGHESHLSATNMDSRCTSWQGNNSPLPCFELHFITTLDEMFWPSQCFIVAIKKNQERELKKYTMKSIKDELKLGNSHQEKLLKFPKKKKN